MLDLEKSSWREDLPSDDGDLAGKTELLESRSEGLVDAVLERNSLDLDVLDSRDDRLAVIDFNVVLYALTLLIVDDVDRILLGGLVLEDGGGLECAEGRDGGSRAEARTSTGRGPDGGAEERHGECVKWFDVGG